jgi:DNA polymerase Ligase (LigD)
MTQEAREGRFVVLEHQWNGVHWDFMLEAGDCLRTWAVDAPIIAEVTLPARGLPNHRRAYLDYEGPVSGQRGSVRRVAEGTFQTIVWSDEYVRVRLSGAQLVGEVELYRVREGIECPSGSTSWTFRLGKAD